MNEKTQVNGMHGMDAVFQTDEGQNAAGDLRKTLDRLIRHWYWFVLCAVLGLFLSWLYLRYATPSYKIKGKILVQDDQKGSDLPGEEILSQLQMFNNKSSVDNEVEILKSRTLMEKVVRDMELNTTYFVEGRVKKTEQFVKLPFTFHWLTMKDTLDEVKYVLKPLNEKEFTLNYKDVSRKAAWNDTLHLPEGIVWIRRNDQFPLLNDEYLIKMQSIDNTVSDYQLLLDIDVPNKQVSTIDLSLTATIPDKGEKVLNKLLDAYLQASVEDKNRIADSTISFIDNRLVIVSAELAGVEKDIQQFKQSNQLANLEEQSKLLVATTGDLSKQLTEQQVRLSIVETLEQYIRDEQNNKRVVPSSLIIQDPTFIALVEKYNSLQLERERALLSNTETNPFVQNLNQQLKGLRTDLQNNLASLKQGIQAGLAGLQHNANLVSSEIRSVPGKERVFLDYSRQQTVKQELYLFLLKKREESAISKSSNIAIARIIDLGKSEPLPFKPRRALTYLLGLIGGILLLSAWLYLRELLNRRVTDKEDITKNTPAPILAEIGHNANHERVVVEKESRSPVAEQFRAMRTNLQFILSGKKEKVILLTSSMSGEGKSFVATNLAAVLALSGKSVVLMEMDLRKPKISQMLGLPNQLGFSTYAIGKVSLDELIKPSGIHDNFWLIPSGPIPPNPVELLLLERTEQLFAELKEQFDYVIIDTAPIGLVTDAQILGRFADATLYLVRQGYTFKQQVQLIKELYQQRKLPK
ncbi:MAG TPA: polysaccharide biosynthesis tyrosine autokinase, partial [Chitinophaga sp.]|uniref:GumC family protein n=1 Tax=Chitinophaga sp. TaxID=1869181 RepID=UPI002F951864